MPTNDQTEPKTVNYWKKNKDDLIALYHERDLPGDPTEMSRKAQIEAIKKWDEEHPEEAQQLQAQFIPAEVDGANPEAPSKLEQVKLAPDGKPLRKFKHPMMLVVFHYRTDNEPDTVQLGMNGICMNVPKDTEILIPEFYLDVMETAVEPRDVTRTDPVTGETKTVTAMVPRLSYTILQRGIK